MQLHPQHFYFPHTPKAAVFSILNIKILQFALSHTQSPLSDLNYSYSSWYCM